MNATLRNLILCALPLATLGSGCLHHFVGGPGRAGGARGPATGGMHACPTRGDESSCVESSRVDANGTLRHHVVERTTPGDRCDLVVVEQASFDPTGILIERVIEDRRCRVVDRRVSTRYDVQAGVVEHRVRRDEDHDDVFDTDRVVRVPMTDQVRVLAQTTAAARMARLEVQTSAEHETDAAPEAAPPTLLATMRH